MARLITLLFSWLYIAVVSAYEVSPIYLELNDIGKDSRGVYKVTNVEEQPILLEVQVYKADFSTGKEILTPSDGDFLILPPQARIEGLKTQTFRVRHIPNKAIKKTTTYRIVFSQIELENKIEEENEDSSISMLLEFATLAFVSPESSKSKPRVSIQNNQVKVTNEGQRVLNMNGMAFNFTGGKSNKTIDWEILSNQTSAYLMPGRTVKYPLPAELGQPKKVTIKTME